jgi:hypothetical protein
MNRDMLQKHYLALAERHVRQGEAHLSKQEALVLKLEHAGRDSTLARTLLENMRATQVLHLQDRDRLMAELAL